MGRKKKKIKFDDKLEPQGLGSLVVKRSHKTEAGGYSTYTIDEKWFAIGLLEASRRDRGKGELVPQYTQIENLLGISMTTLREWYKNKNEIEKKASAVLEKTPESVALSLAFMMKAQVAELSTRIPDMANRDLIAFFATTVSKFQLLTNRSTANINMNVKNYVPPT